jgi:hypothetical protein
MGMGPGFMYQILSQLGTPGDVTEAPMIRLLGALRMTAYTAPLAKKKTERL